MVSAYVLIQTDMDKSAEVAGAIAAMDGVVPAPMTSLRRRRPRPWMNWASS